jgi:hypothetical protein
MMLADEYSGGNLGEVVYVDRYGALGMERPNLLRVCDGYCEGVGYYPVKAHEPTAEYYEKHPHMMGVYPSLAPHRGLTLEEAFEVQRIQADQGIQDDGWYFVACADCGGAGKCSWARTIRRVPGHLVSTVRFVRFAFAHRHPDFSWWQNAKLVFKIVLERPI